MKWNADYRIIPNHSKCQKFESLSGRLNVHPTWNTKCVCKRLLWLGSCKEGIVNKFKLQETLNPVKNLAKSPLQLRLKKNFPTCTHFTFNKNKSWPFQNFNFISQNPSQSHLHIRITFTLYSQHILTFFKWEIVWSLYRSFSSKTKHSQKHFQLMFFFLVLCTCTSNKV